MTRRAPRIRRTMSKRERSEQILELLDWLRDNTAPYRGVDRNDLDEVYHLLEEFITNAGY